MILPNLVLVRSSNRQAAELGRRPSGGSEPHATVARAGQSNS